MYESLLHGRPCSKGSGYSSEQDECGPCSHRTDGNEKRWGMRVGNEKQADACLRKTQQVKEVEDDLGEGGAVLAVATLGR